MPGRLAHVITILCVFRLLVASKFLFEKTKEVEWKHAQESCTGCCHRNGGDAATHRLLAKHSFSEALSVLAMDHRLNFVQENLAPGPHFCGQYKCLFPLVNDPRVGYVASRKGSMLDLMQKAHNFAKRRIADRFDMEHVYLSSPEQVNAGAKLNESLLEWMDLEKEASSKGRNVLPHYFSSKPEKRARGLSVQLVEIISSDALYFGCSKNKYLTASKAFEGFIERIHSLGSRHFDCIRARFRSNFAKLENLLREEPCLYRDFQIFLLPTGRFVHFDVDRCFSNFNISRIQERCDAYIHELERNITHRLEQLQH